MVGIIQANISDPIIKLPFKVTHSRNEEEEEGGGGC